MVDMKKSYKILNSINYDIIFLDIVIIEEARLTKSQALKKAVSYNTFHLIEDKLTISNYKGEVVTIDSNEKNRYKCEVYMKEPFYKSGLSLKELINKLENEESSTEESDSQAVDWSLKDIYYILKEVFPQKEIFDFESIAYGIE